MSLPLQPSERAMCDLYDRYESTLDRMVEEWRSDPSGIQKWTTVSPQRMKKIWGEFTRTGMVRDIRGLDRICDRVVENILRIWINTDLAGHSQADPEHMLESHDLPPFEIESFINWAISTAPRTADGGYGGAMRITDFGLRKLQPIAALILSAKTAEQKSVYLNMAMDVAHQRSDLSAWLVEGGQFALSEISGNMEALNAGGDTDPADEIGMPKDWFERAAAKAQRTIKHRPAA